MLYLIGLINGALVISVGFIGYKGYNFYIDYMNEKDGLEDDELTRLVCEIECLKTEVKDIKGLCINDDLMKSFSLDTIKEEDKEEGENEEIIDFEEVLEKQKNGFIRLFS